MVLFLKEKIITPLMGLLKQGITPSKLAQSFIAGMLLGCFPMLGFTTAMCVGVAQVFKLNHVAIQIANYAVYPLQFLLLIPYWKLGSVIFHSKPVLLDVSIIVASFKNNFTHALQDYGIIAFHGVVAWIVTSPIVALLLYYPFRFAFRQLAVKMK